MFILTKELILLEFIVVTVTCLHILYYRQKNVLTWIGLVIFAPLLGSFIYLLFGINRVERLANKLRRGNYRPRQINSEHLDPSILSHYKYSQIVHQQGFTVADQITVLENGEEVYPEMLRQIDAAKVSIALSTYIFEKGKVGDQFIKSLAAAVKRGVAVRVIIDPFSRMYQIFQKIDRDFKKNNIDYTLFLKPKSPFTLKFLNLRNHRKLLIVDGKIGFIGGINIRDSHLVKESRRDLAVRDVHFKVSGPIINQMNLVFEEDWFFSKKQLIKLPKYECQKKDLNSLLGHICRIVPDGPDMDIWKMQNMLLGMLNFAKKEVKIVTPYFLPNQVLLNALIFIARRGVKIELILPEKSNLFYFSWASESNYRQLLEAGIKIYLSESPFDHSKMMLVDNHLSVIGSGNWDERSIRLNFEVNMEVVSVEFNQKLRKVFAGKKKKARRLKMFEVEQYSFARIIRNNFFKMFENVL